MLTGLKLIFWKPNRILFRITLPFTLLFATVALLTWASSLLMAGHFFDQGLKQQLLRVANGISQSSFLLNPHVLRQVKEMVDADIALIDPAGQVLSSTIDEQWLDNIPVYQMIEAAGAGRTVHEASINDQPYRAVFQEVTLPDQGRMYLSLWQPTAVARAFKTSIFMITGGIALLGVFAMALAGYWVARSISIPVVRLAEVSDRVASGDFHSKVAVLGNDEIAQLGHSFNAMIDRLQESERKLVEAGKLAAAGQLAAGVAHEIKNPLTAIKMFVQVLQGRMAADPKNLETLGIVLSEIDRLDRIVEQIVHRARPEDGVRLEITSLADILSEVVRVCQDSLQAAHIVLSVDVATAMPLVPVDREKIKQVLWNIIVNAKDSMPRGGQLAVSARHSSATGIVELTFEDNGVGLADGVKPEACFDSFFTTKPEGLGLGLTMSRQIVARHGGTLTLAPREEGGVQVVVALPCAPGKNRE